VGNGAFIQHQVVIGSLALGYHFTATGERLQFPHLGIAIIGEQAVIGPGSVVARGQLDDTCLGRGVRLSNLVSIAHNVKIDDDSVLSSGVLVAGGASIGAFHSAALLCRYPDVFSKALCMSGTYNLMRFIEAKHPTEDFRRASPLYFLPHVGGRHLELLRQRYVHIVTGEGRYESLPESWGLANALGHKKVPNYVENWGPDWHHDWITWRAMLPKILGQWTA
jgi:hypothetical protein